MADVYVSSSATSSPSRHITVLDVYDLASSIKLDLDEIVKNYGQRCVQDLACKVVSALETLEALAKNNDQVNSEVTELKSTIDRLESERLSRNRDKEHFEKEMVEFEETLKRENDDLWAMVRSLQTEKKQLQDRISNLAEQSVEEKEREVIKQEEYQEKFQALVLLKSQNTAQKEQIKELKSNMRTAETEAEDLKRHIERLFSQNYELVRKNKSLQKQCKSLIRERLDLVEKVEAMEENNLQLKQTLQETSRACRDLENQSRRIDDSSSPRFSLNELREVLQEKTNLKQLVIQLREELDAIKFDRPGSVSGASESTFDTSETAFPRPSSTSVCESELDKTGDESNNRTNDEELVYGPINKEPDEKLHPWKYQRKASGIRKMFNIFFSAPSPR